METSTPVRLSLARAGATRRELSLEVAVTLVWVASAAAAAVAVLGDTRLDQPPLAEVGLGLVISGSFAFCGLIAHRQWPEGASAAAMIAVGFLYLITLLQYSDVAGLFTAGIFFESIYIVALAFLLLTLPRGRLQGWWDRVLFAFGLIVTVAGQVAWMVLAEPSALECDGCPANVLQIARHDVAAATLVDLQRLAGSAALVVVIATAAVRWARSPEALRRAGTPIVVVVALTFLAIGIAALNDALDDPLGDAPDIAWQLLLAAVPVAILAGLLRLRLARAAVASLVVQLGSDPTRRHLRDLLARALGDPTVQLAYPDDEGAVWFDADGREQTWPDEDLGATRHIIRIERQGRVVAVLSHDPDIVVDPALVDSVIAAAGLALDNERLQADLRATIEALRASRARIVQAGQEERRRLERNLHDGAQQRIVAVAMTLSLAEARLPEDAADARTLVDEARTGLLRSLDELRRLSQGIHPALLTERGLGPALEELVGGSPLPVDLDVDERRCHEDAEAAAYYVVAESLANAAKHAQATRVRVRIAREDGRLRVTIADDGIGGADVAGGSGLAGLTDRVEALGGRLRVDSAAGRGTTIETVLPCA